MGTNNMDSLGNIESREDLLLKLAMADVTEEFRANILASGKPLWDFTDYLKEKYNTDDKGVTKLFTFYLQGAGLKDEFQAKLEAAVEPLLEELYESGDDFSEKEFTINVSKIMVKEMGDYYVAFAKKCEYEKAEGLAEALCVYMDYALELMDSEIEDALKSNK